MTDTMTDLITYVRTHTARGECQCGRCIDKGDTPDPVGHTVDMTFFKVAMIGTPDANRFRALTAANEAGAFCGLNPLDGLPHNYIEIGAWIGDQGLAMQYMALGALLNVCKLVSPAMLPVSPELQQRMLDAGFLFIQHV